MFSSAGWAIRRSRSKCCLCVYLDVNQAGTNRNHCTWGLVVLHAQTTNEPWLNNKSKVSLTDFMGSKSSTEKMVWIGIFK